MPAEKIVFKKQKHREKVRRLVSKILQENLTDESEEVSKDFAEKFARLARKAKQSDGLSYQIKSSEDELDPDECAHC